MTGTGVAIENIIRKLLMGEDYHSEVLTLIDAEFLEYVVDFFRQIVKAKLDKESTNLDRYIEEFLSSHSPSNSEVSAYSEIATETPSNSKQIVLDTPVRHHEALYDAFNSLENDLDMEFTIKLNKVSFDLDLNESLIAFNTLGFKRLILQDRLWSETEKQVKKPLMATLCALFQVPKKYFDQRNLPESQRASDFHLFDDTGRDYPCEVKLMGKSHPESADAVYAYDSRVIVANKLSESSKRQMDSESILWVELQTENGYKRFAEVLKTLSIPYKPFDKDLQETLNKILPAVLFDDAQDFRTP